MKRRNFLQLVGAAVVAPSLPIPKAAPVLTEPEWPVDRAVNKTVKWQRFYPLRVSTTPLCEGRDPPGGSVDSYEAVTRMYERRLLESYS